MEPIYSYWHNVAFILIFHQNQLYLQGVNKLITSRKLPIESTSILQHYQIILRLHCIFWKIFFMKRVTSSSESYLGKNLIILTYLEISMILICDELIIDPTTIYPNLRLLDEEILNYKMHTNCLILMQYPEVCTV